MLLFLLFVFEQVIDLFIVIAYTEPLLYNRSLKMELVVN